MYNDNDINERFLKRDRMILLILFYLACICYVHGAEPMQLMSAQRLAQFKKALPQVDDKDWIDFFYDPSTLYYTDDEIPPAFQHNMEAARDNVTTFHTPFWNFSADDEESRKPHGKGGNGNIEFPWLKPGGTDAAGNRVNSFKMLWLPKQSNGQPFPIVIWLKRAAMPREYTDPPHSIYAWTFPRGTIFGEVLLQKDSRGYDYAFEIRVRMRADTYWDTEILRPFPTSDAYAKALPAEFRKTFESRHGLQLENFIDQTHAVSAFSAKAVHDPLPAIPEQIAANLLRRTPFRSSVGYVWSKQPDGEPSFAPTNQTNTLQIVPSGYTGTLLGTSNDSCIKCHESTGKNVNFFTPGRGWYGHIRGSDGIFTWHPIAPGSIASGGNTIPVRFREEFQRAGMIAEFNPAIHTAERYKSLK